MKRRKHVLAMAGLVARHVDEQPRRAARLLSSQLRCAAERPEPGLAHEPGVAQLVERARDEYLASLGPDDGLTVLCVEREEVIDLAVRVLDTPRSRCARCGARLPRRRPVCTRCRWPIPRNST
jgi:hypothetical protein